MRISGSKTIYKYSMDTNIISNRKNDCKDTGKSNSQTVVNFIYKLFCELYVAVIVDTLSLFLFFIICC